MKHHELVHYAAGGAAVAETFLSSQTGPAKRFTLEMVL